MNDEEILVYCIVGLRYRTGCSVGIATGFRGLEE